MLYASSSRLSALSECKANVIFAISTIENLRVQKIILMALQSPTHAQNMLYALSSRRSVLSECKANVIFVISTIENPRVQKISQMELQ